MPYVDRMDLAYAAADFALCRAGAMTCAELTAVGLPAAYVPLPHGNGEQRLNAVPIVAGGGGLLVDDADLTPDWIRDVLLPVLLDIDRVAAMSEAAAALGRADADRALASAVIDVVEAASGNHPCRRRPPQRPGSPSTGSTRGDRSPAPGPPSPRPSPAQGPPSPRPRYARPGPVPVPGGRPGRKPSRSPIRIPGTTRPGRRGQPRHGRPRRGS